MYQVRGPNVALRVGLRIVALMIQNFGQAQIYSKREPRNLVRQVPCDSVFLSTIDIEKIKSIKN